MTKTAIITVELMNMGSQLDGDRIIDWKAGGHEEKHEVEFEIPENNQYNLSDNVLAVKALHNSGQLYLNGCGNTAVWGFKIKNIEIAC